MNCFLLPHTSPLLYQKLKAYCHEHPEPSHSLATYLLEIKEKICLFDSWDIYKEYTNTYEYIHTKTPYKKSVSNYQPLSRSYFKMVELLKHFSLLEKYHSQPIQTFHLAEGPGGFTEAVANVRRETTSWYTQDKYRAISLINDQDRTVPSWRKCQAFIKTHPQTILEYGEDRTGNLLHMNNFTTLVEQYGSTMEFITADGGFDFSDDFNRQELCILPLLVAQISYALCLQKARGSFILKVFDCFLPATVDLLYLLSSFYENVYVTKPLTSRMANSEKYIVCDNFHYENNIAFYPMLRSWMETVVSMEKSQSLRFLNVTIPRLFLSKIDEILLILGHQQINNIFSTLSLINTKVNKNQKVDYLIRTHISKCIYWCQKHGIPIDHHFI